MPMHPIQILESCAVETGWNDNSMLAIACDFLQMQGITNPALIGAFERYVLDRMEDEAETDWHCGMCEHDWRAPSPESCPSCGSDEIETLADALTHNEAVIKRADADPSLGGRLAIDPNA